MDDLVPSEAKGKTKYRTVSVGSTKQRKWEVFCHNYRVANYNIEKACEATGVTYRTFCRWRNEDPEFLQLIAQTETFLVHKAFAKTAQLIDEGDGATLRHFQNAQDPRFKKIVKHEHNGRIDHVHGRLLEDMSPEEKNEQLRALVGDEVVDLLDRNRPTIDVTEAEEAEVMESEGS